MSEVVRREGGGEPRRVLGAPGASGCGSGIHQETRRGRAARRIHGGTFADFADLRGLEGRLYRGLSIPAAISLARAVGVGPFREVAATAIRERITLDDAMCLLLERALTEIPAKQRVELGYIPVSDLPPARLERVVQWSHVAGVSALDMADHVMHDFDALLSPNVARSTDSVSLSPRVAILYAYGIRTEDFLDRNEIAYYSGAPSGPENNKKPSVALLVADAEACELNGPAFERLKVHYSDPGPPVREASIEEVRQRVNRDEERLVRGVARAASVVELPDFDVDDAEGSLDRAAAKLVAERVASRAVA